MAQRIQIRRDTAINWTTNNPILADGELGFETDTNKLKVGNGVSNWNSLSYISGSSSDAGLNLPNFMTMDEDGIKVYDSESKTNLISVIGHFDNGNGNYFIDDFTQSQEVSCINQDVTGIFLSLGSSNLVPQMTDYDKPSGLVTYSSVWNDYITDPSYAGYSAFDRNASTQWISDGMPAWIAYEFPSSVTINTYSLRPVNSFLNRAPGAWTIQGWDGTSWITLDTRSGYTNWSENEIKEFTMLNTTAYKKYKFDCTTRSDGTTVGSISPLHVAEWTLGVTGVYIPMGYRISQPVLLEGALPNIYVKWIEEKPNNTNIKIETGISDSKTIVPTVWVEQQNDSLITNLPLDFTGQYLWVKETLISTDGISTPKLVNLLLYEYNPMNGILGVNVGFTELRDVPDKYYNNAGKGLRVNDTETGLEFTDVDASKILAKNIDVGSFVGKHGYVLAYDETNDRFYLKADDVEGGGSGINTVKTITNIGAAPYYTINTDLPLNPGSAQYYIGIDFYRTNIVLQ